MICDGCNQNEATFHSIKIINGMKSERHLCVRCQSNFAAPEAAVSPVPGLAGLFSNFAAFSGQLDAPRREVKTCPGCGVTSAEALKSGFLGCARCYGAFGEILLPLIQKVQSGTLHKGKNPQTDGAAGFIAENEYERLRTELAAAVEAENYEEAAILQSKLRALRGD